MYHSSSPLQGSAARVFAQLEQEFSAGKLAHGILLAGPQGIGKATLAYALTHKILGEGAGVAERIAARSHADLLVIERAYDEKKEELAKEILAEQTREISEFLSLTAGESAWRVVIIDGAEYMNHTAANAILKILEEPPANTVIILVAHHASRLLPTIRSRCRLYKISPLSPEDCIEIMRQKNPEIGRHSCEKLGELTDYSPGLALQLYAQDALDMQGQLDLIMAELPQIAHERVFAMAEQIASGKQHQNWQLFTRLVLHWLATQARKGNSSYWAEKWQQTSHDFTLCETRHLDYKSAVINFFHREQIFS